MEKFPSDDGESPHIWCLGPDRNSNTPLKASQKELKYLLRNLCLALRKACSSVNEVRGAGFCRLRYGIYYRLFFQDEFQVLFRLDHVLFNELLS
jgi:hypothetical protein